MLKLNFGVTEDADRVQQHSKKMSVSFMILSATGITVVLVDGLFWLRGDEDGAWVFSGAGRISKDRGIASWIKI